MTKHKAVAESTRSWQRRSAPVLGVVAIALGVTAALAAQAIQSVSPPLVGLAKSLIHRLSQRLSQRPPVTRSTGHGSWRKTAN